MRRTMMVLAVVAVLIVALAVPAFAGNARGQNNSNYGFYQNDYNFANSSQGFYNGGDTNNNNGGWRIGDYRN